MIWDNTEKHEIVKSSHKNVYECIEKHHKNDYTLYSYLTAYDTHYWYTENFRIKKKEDRR